MEVDLSSNDLRETLKDDLDLATSEQSQRNYSRFVSRREALYALRRAGVEMRKVADCMESMREDALIKRAREALEQMSLIVDSLEGR